MHSLKLRAAMAATLPAIAAVSPAAAQFFDTPPPVPQEEDQEGEASRTQAATRCASHNRSAHRPHPLSRPQSPHRQNPVSARPTLRPTRIAATPKAFRPGSRVFKKDAAAAGIRPTAVNAVLDGMSIDGKVTARDRGQKFFSQTFLDFQGKLATPNQCHLRTQEDRPTTPRSSVRSASTAWPPSSPASGAWRATSAPISATTRSSARWPRSPMTAGVGCSSASNCSDALRIIERGDLQTVAA